MEFNIDTFLTGKYVVRTRNLVPARIVCTDMKSDTPIVALVQEPIS